MSPIKTSTRTLGREQAFIVSSVESQLDPKSAAHTAYTQIASALREQKKEVFHERIFASLEFETQILAGRKQALDEHDIPANGPVTIIEGQPAYGKGLAGVIIHAVSNGDGGRLQEITHQERVVGRRWKNSGNSYIILQNIHGDLNEHSQDGKFVRGLLEQAKEVLHSQGSSYLEVVRTWFYIEDILKWYDNCCVAGPLTLGVSRLMS